MQAKAQAYSVASEETTLTFKRHILQKTSGFESELMTDLYRVQLLGMMLDRYDELSEKGLGELSCRSRVIDEFSDIAARMREEGFEELKTNEAKRLSRWPQLSEGEAECYIRECDAYMHRTAIGTALCTACVTPLMIGAAFSEFWYADAFSMLGLVGMFAMIGMGVYTITTAVKPKGEKKIRKGRFSLAARLRRKLEQLREEIEDRARRRKGKGVAVIVMSLIPIFFGAALTELWWSDGWAVLGVAGMFPMIALGVYELVMADGERKTMKNLLDHKEK